MGLKKCHNNKKTKTPIKSDARKLKQKGVMGGKIAPPTHSLTHMHTQNLLCVLYNLYSYLSLISDLPHATAFLMCF